MQLSIEIPDEIFFSLNENEQNLKQFIQQKLALELYKSHKISLSQGAKMTGMDIYAFMDLLGKNNIEVMSDYDIEDEFEKAKALLS